MWPVAAIAGAVGVVLLLLWWSSPFGRRSRGWPASSTRKRGFLEALEAPFVVVDLETTGFRPEWAEITEIAAVRYDPRSGSVETFQRLVQVRSGKVPRKIVERTGITSELLAREGVHPRVAVREFVEFAGSSLLVAYNAPFDASFLERACRLHGVPLDTTFVCALRLARRAWPGRRGYSLAVMAADLNLATRPTHRALSDATAALSVFRLALGSIIRDGRPASRILAACAFPMRVSPGLQTGLGFVPATSRVHSSSREISSDDLCEQAVLDYARSRSADGGFTMSEVRKHCWLDPRVHDAVDARVRDALARLVARGTLRHYRRRYFLVDAVAGSPSHPPPTISP